MKVEETVRVNCRFMAIWNDRSKFESGSARKYYVLQIPIQRSTEEEMSSSVIQVRFQGSSIVSVLASGVGFFLQKFFA